MDENEDPNVPTSGAGGLNILRAMTMGANPLAGLDMLKDNPTDPSTKWLNFASGALAPTKGGHFSESMSNAYGAMADSQTKEAELKAKYAPILAQAMLQRQMMAFQMYAKQYELTQTWDSSLTGSVTGLLHKPDLSLEDVAGAVAQQVRLGKVPQDFAQTWFQSMPEEPEALRQKITAKAISAQDPSDRLKSVVPQYDIKDTNGQLVPLQTNPTAPGGVGAGPFTLPKELSPTDRLPKIENTPYGPRATNPVTGSSDIVGTPGGHAVFAEAASGIPGARPAATPGMGAPGTPPPVPAGSPPVQGRANPPGTVPPIGTSAAIDPARMKLEETSATDLSKYAGSLGEVVATMRDLQSRIQEMRKQAEQFRPGATAEMRGKVGAFAKDMAQNFGLAPERATALGNKIAGGDVAAMQAFQKLTVQGAMEALRTAMDSAGRITQAEFAIFQRNNPNLEMDPGALDKIYNFITKSYQRNAMEQNALNDYVKGGGTQLLDFHSMWDKKSETLGLTKPTLESGMIKGSNPPPVKERVGTSVSGRRIKEVSPGKWVYMD